MSDIKKGWLLLSVMLFICYITVMWKWGHDDMYFWKDWSIFIYDKGFTNIYDSGCNYLPAYLYFLYFHTKVQASIQNIHENLYSIKFYTLVFDFLGAYAAVWFIKDIYKKIFFFFFLVLNISYMYNTVCWGQVDAIFSFWGFASLVAAVERKTVLSILLLLIALNFKLQGVVFIPVVGLLLLPQILSKEGIKKLFVAIIAGIFIQLIIVAPFIIAGRLNEVIAVITHSVDFYPYTYMGAFNFWAIVTYVKEGQGLINDSGMFWIFTYKKIGTMMFVIAVLLSVLPLMKNTIKKLLKKNTDDFPLQKVFLTAALIPLVFFYFNTQMHERYSHPALLSIAAYTFCTGRWTPIVLGSVAYFLNMEKVFKYLEWTNYGTALMDARLIAVIYLILIAYLYYLLYSKPKEEINAVPVTI